MAIKTDDVSERQPLSSRAAPPVRAPLSPRRSSKRKLKKFLIALIIIVLAAGAGYFAYKYNQANNEAKRLSDPKVAATQQVDNLVAQVGKLVELPSGQTPTVATVTDSKKLASQTFFKNAVNGDKVLIYTQAKRAVLYRPSTNKVIEIAPLNIGSNGQASGTSAQ